jgi:Holliday junction resolvase
MNETQFKTKVMRKLKEKGGFWYKTSDKFVRGIPDILGCFKGKFYALELKVGKNKATDLQKYTVDEINENEGKAYVVYPDNFPEVLESIE